MINRVIHGDCLEEMKKIPDKSIDMILCDLPYGTTHCKWDAIIPFGPLWEQYERIIKDNGAIVLTATQPFTSALVMSNPKLFKCEWIYNKTMLVNPAQVKKYPAKKHENVLIFCKTTPVYNPQMEMGDPYKDNRNTMRTKTGVFGEGTKKRKPIINSGERYPSSVQLFKNSNHNSLHPTQKPIELFEYLIKTYTNEGAIVLDNAAGSGTTAIAALNTGRNYILIEKEKNYIDIINKRISEHTPLGV
ncbi:site-specific DNA-methyltransferase [Solibacillus sp. FSL W8-0474]|uniref:DNA-methyltransferase n=1 Tax=Solibacillus sp. FSL W8-0474 TaxID=2975336 RepID=UPI0030FD1095